MDKILTPEQKKELSEIMPDLKEKVFIKKAIAEAIQSLKAAMFFDISEKIRRGMKKEGYSLEKLLTDFKD